MQKNVRASILAFLACVCAVAMLRSSCGDGAESVRWSNAEEASSEELSPSPEERIQQILLTPFRGDPDSHAVFFLDDYEDAAREIGKAGVPTLVRALESADSQLRLKAVLCLIVIGPDAAPAVKALRPLLTSRVDRQAYWTIICLGEIGKASMAAVPDLLALLKHPRGCPFWEQIGETVGQIAIKNGRLPKGLGELLNHKSPGARQGALFALGECGKSAEPLVPKIIAMLRDRHVLVRIHAALALGKIKRRLELTIPALVKAFDDPKASVRIAAARAIGDFGKDASSAVPHLIKLLGSPISRVRYEAAVSLGKIGPAGGAAMPALKAALSDENESVRQAAQKALESLQASKRTGN